MCFFVDDLLSPKIWSEVTVIQLVVSHSPCCMCSAYDSTVVYLFYHFPSWGFETQTASRPLLCGHTRCVFGEHVCTNAWWVHVHASACEQAVALCADSACFSTWMCPCSIPSSDESSCCFSHGFFKPLGIDPCF